MKWIIRANCLVLCCHISVTMAGDCSPWLTLVKDWPVPSAQVNVFASGLAVSGSEVFVTHLADQPSHDHSLAVVIHHGHPSQGGGWQWEDAVIDTTVIPDPYHTQPSLGIDRGNSVHVAYGMHNMPWQYMRSLGPMFSRGFQFLGQFISQNERWQVRVLNHTPFKDEGHAAIPGNQITYPTFFNDRKGQLYITYRYARFPNAKFPERDFSGAIAAYDERRGVWELPYSRDMGRLHGNIAFASSHEWAVYLPRLAFDRANGMHVFWFWRHSGPGRTAQDPSYAFSPDGGRHFYRSDGTAYTLPITHEKAERIPILPGERFWPRAYLLVDQDDDLYVNLRNTTSGSRFYRLSSKREGWDRLPDIPLAASGIHLSSSGAMRAIATGPVILERTSTGWKLLCKHAGKLVYRYPDLGNLPDRKPRMILMQDKQTRSMALFAYGDP